MRTRTPGLLRRRALLGVLALPCLLAACGSSARKAPSASGPSTVTRTVTRTPSTSATSSATTTTSSTPTTRTPPQPAGTQCVAADLAPSFIGGNGATGHAELGFALRNTSSHGCRTGGYPGIQFLDAAGRPLPTHPIHTTSDFFGHTLLRELTVAPGVTVSFRLGVSHLGAGGSNAGCVTAKVLQVIAPNDTATMRVPLRGGISECAGKVTVSPIQPGTSAYR
ncbi:MAG TPA: DUF4232 domain-containing protein [Solirubrobacteraceae bacterium]|nr:DUF4232 domain-containing protein [Solirubrobacteraceae bacterium]